METNRFSIPVTVNQIIGLARQLPYEDKKRLLDALNQDVDAEQIHTHWASEQVLSKDWLDETEEKTWQHL